MLNDVFSGELFKMSIASIFPNNPMVPTTKRKTPSIQNQDFSRKTSTSSNGA